MDRPLNKARLRAPVERPAWPHHLLACSGIALAAAAHAQETSHRVVVEPSVRAMASVSDNSRLSSTDRQSEVITELSAGVRADARTGRVQGSLDYVLTGAVYSKHSEDNYFRNNLLANGSAEFIQNHLYVDGFASIERRVISAFGTQEAQAGLINANATETGVVRIAPVLRGKLAGVVDYEAKVAREVDRSKGTELGDMTSTFASGRLSSGYALWSWAVDASRITNDFTVGRRTDEDRMFATLSVAPIPDLRLSIRGGREANNVATLERTVSETYGVGMSWLPSERTTLSLDLDHRYFGQSHSVVFEHRSARTVWRFSDSLSESSSQSSRTVTAYDLYFAQFASQVPDPLEREAFVRLFLSLQGIDPNATISGGFLTSSVTLERRRDFSVALTGLRTTYTLIAFANASRRLDIVTPIVGDDLSTTDIVRQQGLVFNVGHRLTPQSSLSLAASRLKTQGSTSALGNDLLSLNLMWTGRIDSRTSFSLTGRHTESESTTNPYTESALIATIGLRF